MKILIPAVAILGLAAGCTQISVPLQKVGVGPTAQADCMELVRIAINDPDRETLKDRLKIAGMMCLVAAANDVLTVDAEPAPTPALAGAIVAEDAEAAAAVKGETFILAP